MAGCEHKSCGGAEKVWLPHIYRGRHIGLKPHPFCSQCGLVKNLSSDKPRKMGYYVNILAALRDEFKIAQVQMRLLVEEMKRSGFEDPYGMDRQIQEQMFVNMVKEHLNVPERAVMERL